jgi:hypothetical protein
MTPLKQITEQLKTQVSEPISNRLDEVVISIQGDLNRVAPEQSLISKVREVAEITENYDADILDQLKKLTVSNQFIADTFKNSRLDDLEARRESRAPESALAPSSSRSSSAASIAASQDPGQSGSFWDFADTFSDVGQMIAAGSAGALLTRIVGTGRSALALGARGGRIGVGIGAGFIANSAVDAAMTGFGASEGLANFGGNIAQGAITGFAIAGPYGAALGAIAGVIYTGLEEVADGIRRGSEVLTASAEEAEARARNLINASNAALEEGNIDEALQNTVAASRELEAAGGQRTNLTPEAVQQLRENIAALEERDPSAAAMIRDEAGPILARDEFLDGADPETVVATAAVRDLLAAVPDPSLITDDALINTVERYIDEGRLRANIDANEAHNLARQLLRESAGSAPTVGAAPGGLSMPTIPESTQPSSTIDTRPSFGQLLDIVTPSIGSTPLRYNETLERDWQGEAPLNDIRSYLQGIGDQARLMFSPVIQQASATPVMPVMPIVNNYNNTSVGGQGSSSASAGSIVTRGDRRYS